MKLRNIFIEDYKIFKDFKIDFDFNNNSLDIIILAGINGSGKSTLLEFIYKFICGHGRVLSKNKNNKIIGTATDQETGRQYQYNFGESFISPFSSVIDLEDPSSVNDCIVKYFALNSNYSKTTNNIIVDYIDKLIYEKDKKSSEVYEIVRERLNSIFEGFDLQVEFNLLDKERNIFFRNEKSEKIPLDQLSGGEKELVTKAFTLYVSDIKDKVILIDEPESSLHPKWQNRILKIYEDFAKENNNQIIIATHSPHIIASAKKESLRLLVKRNSKIEVVSGFESTYGQEVQKILLDVMDLESLRVPIVAENIEHLYDLLGADKYNSAEYKKLYLEMENLLGKGDRDLMLMRLELAKKKKLNEKD